MNSTIQEFPSDAEVCDDLRKLLNEIQFGIQLDGHMVNVDKDSALAVVARSVHEYADQMIGFGDHFRFCIAVGGVLEIAHGVPVAGTCFASMIYSKKGKLITNDFLKNMP